MIFVYNVNILFTIDYILLLHYCIMRPYTEGRLDRYRIGIPRELFEICTQPWLSEGSLTCSQPRTSDLFISHWRALCLLAFDNWRCSIQPEIFTRHGLPELGFKLRSTARGLVC